MSKEKNVFAQEYEKVKNADIEDVINDMKVANPVQSLRLSIFEFFKNRLKHIEKDSALRDATEQALLQKISKNELSVNQLINLMNDVKQQNTIATDSVFSILKPVPNSTSILDSNIDRQERENNQPLGDLSPKENEALQQLSQLLQVAQQQKEKRENVDPIQDAEYTIDDSD